jgi:hypothetical protein
MKPLNLKQYKSAETAARKLHAWVCEKSRELGQDPAIETALWSPEQAAARGYSKSWMVCWESGPYDWAVALSLGSAYTAGETGRYSEPDREVQMLGANGWFCEPYYSFNLSFIED